MRHAEWKAYDLLVGDCEPEEKEANRETVRSARIFGSQLLAYEAECRARVAFVDVHPYKTDPISSQCFLQRHREEVSP